MLLKKTPDIVLRFKNEGDLLKMETMLEINSIFWFPFMYLGGKVSKCWELEDYFLLGAVLTLPNL